MKKKTSKSKKSTAPEQEALRAAYDDSSWRTESINAEEAMKMLEAINELDSPNLMCVCPDNLWDLAPDGTARIIVAVADTLTYEKDGKPARYKMEAGRIAAQVGHAVSGLRMEYILAHSRRQPDKARSIVNILLNVPITTIVVGARDSDEIQHILGLAEQKSLLHYAFSDDNEAVYGTKYRILSAIAIGPLHKDGFAGVTDYLPLYKAAGEA